MVGPKQYGSKVAGQLKEGECRFTFIADAALVEQVKKQAEASGVTIKKFMDKVLRKAVKQKGVKGPTKKALLYEELLKKVIGKK